MSLHLNRPHGKLNKLDRLQLHISFSEENDKEQSAPTKQKLGGTKHC